MSNDVLEQVKSILARGNKNQIDNNKDIQDGNSFLLNSYMKPNWFDNFLKNQKESLHNIVCRASGEKELLVTKDYGEGYFNEIVQNANDLHVGKYINISIQEKNNFIIVTCRYRDDGFKIQDIYGFCNTGMSSKDKEHTGKYGIGIKSLFSFVENFMIKSNINMSFKNISTARVESEFSMNNEWDNEHTELEFSFCKSTITSFNISKLNKFCDVLNCNTTENVDEKIKQLLLSSDNTKLLFDTRSLLFTDEQQEPNIEKIRFNNEVILECNTEKTYDGEKYSIKSKVITIKFREKELYSKKVVLFKNKESKMTFGFDNSDENNRIYSVYYLRSLDEFKPLGMYVHTLESNSSRTDLANSKESRNRIIESIKENLAILMEDILNLNDQNSGFKIEISEVFHKCLHAYGSTDIYIGEDLKINKDNIFYHCAEKGKSNCNLLKISSQEYRKPYIVSENKVELYNQFFKIFEAEETESELPRTYKKVIEKNEVLHFDYIVSEKNTLLSVKSIYEEIENLQSWVRFILNYFPNVSEFIKFRISQNSNISGEDIGKWLNVNSENADETYLRKLLGRYQIVDCIDKYGNVVEEKLSFVDFLFSQQNVSAKNSFGEFLIEKFNRDYNTLKEELLKNLQKKFIYYIPERYSYRGWNGVYDFKENNIPQNVLKDEMLLDNFMSILKTDCQCSKNISLVDSNLVLFPVKYEDFKWRNKYWEYYTEEETKAVGVNFLRNLNVTCITKLKIYQEAVDKLVDKLNEGIQVTCILQSVSPKELTNLIMWLIMRKNRNVILPKIVIESININNQKNECDEDKRKFIKNITKKSGIKLDVFQMSFSAEGLNKKHVVAYIRNGIIKIKMVADKDFEEIPSVYKPLESDFLYIFNNESIPSEKALSYVLGKLKISSDDKELIEGYVPIKTIGETITASQYELIKNTKNERSNSFRKINRIEIPTDLSIQKKLLLARGSYNGKCPLCEKQIEKPLDSLIFTIPYNSDYIKGVACKECAQLLKKSLVKVEYDAYLEEIKLHCKYYVGEHQSKEKKLSIKVSDINKCFFNF